MSSFRDALDELRTLPTVADQGYAFEKLMVNYFKADPVLKERYDEVYRWGDWKYNGGKADTGIDLVARRRDDQRWTAIQCKFYLPKTYLQKRNLDSFFEASGHSFQTENGAETFANRIIISTTDNWSSNAESALENQIIKTNRIGLSDIAESPINWDIVFPGSEIQINLTRKEFFEPRPHQEEAITNVLQGFKTHDRGKLIMACGTGKTFTSLRLAERYAAEISPTNPKARVLFLVPSISLLSQSLKEWSAQARLDLRTFAVCSDSKVGKEAEDIASYDLEIPVSTNGSEIAEELSKGKRKAGLTVIFSTYQSLPAIHDAQQQGLDAFDLVICDEAHRTTGATLQGDDPSNFNRVHDANYIKAGKRLYMTATPRLFDDNVKGKAVEHSAELFSMDDEAIYGPEMHRLGFGEAVSKGLLTDYKVLVMTVDESVAADAMARMAPTEELTLTQASAMIGAWNAFAKRSGTEQGKKGGFEEGALPMERAVAFAKDIKTSKNIAASFPQLIASHTDFLREKAVLNDVSLHNVDLRVSTDHVDGGMNALTRKEKLTWLKAAKEQDEIRILTNARCLSEGVDVPALDSVVFFNPRNSIVDVVQSVGRVMRKSEGKEYGYIILPVAVPPGKSPAEVLNDNKRFKVVWQVLNALRAHDERFNAKVSSVNLNEGDHEKLPVEHDHVGDTKTTDNFETSKDEVTQLVLFSLEEWQEAIYTKIVDKVGTRTYWEDWAEDVAGIAQAQMERIRALIDAADPTIRKEFDIFVDGLRGNLNDSITEDDAISMLSQHLITAPVFNALFNSENFAKMNPVARVMQRMVDALDDKKLETETQPLEKFYADVRLRAEALTSASGKQQVIKELYEKFFRKAFKKQSEALGIVYTPVEIVDFILRAANDLSTKHFGRSLSDEGVHILDPFTGTGTFMVRLLQSGFIKPEDLARKYASELHATEIMLLAYYVATANIEMTYNALREEAALRDGTEAPDYEPFQGIALADTFQVYEDGDVLDLDVFRENNAAITRQIEAPINVIVGNPPYSVGQKSANDNNQNLKYPTLDKRIEETYAAKSTGGRKSQLYDSYLRAFRWATDRIGDRGVVAFVSNGGWLDANNGDGVRLSLAEDFSNIYVFNLRGNARTVGEQRRKESGNVFRDGGRTTIAIAIGIKDPTAAGCSIRYRDIGDYLSVEEKLAIVDRSTAKNIEWAPIEPNEQGDWISHRTEEFESWLPLISKDRNRREAVFETSSLGIATNRDPWAYNYSRDSLRVSISRAIEFYNQEVDRCRVEGVEQYQEVNDTQKFKWDRVNRRQVRQGIKIRFAENKIRTGSYRPFNKRNVYFDSDQQLNNCTYQIPNIFPSNEHSNIGFVLTGPSSHYDFGLVATDLLPNLHTLDTGQFFPRFTWEKIEAPEGELDFAAVGVDKPSEASKYGEIGEVVAGYRRVDNVTDEIKKLYRDALGADISGDDIFHFVYGKLHDPEYREKYAADLKKMLPHIETPATRDEFDKFAVAGEKLMALHVGYEDVEPYPVSVELAAGADPEDRETWRVLKMKWKKVRDPETGKLVNDYSRIEYNKKVTIANLPVDAEEYLLGSRSALAWIIDRYQVKKDKASGIVNDPNDWADEVGNPRYIVDLIAKVARVAVETNDIVKGL